jgi:hypothetical protein
MEVSFWPVTDDPKWRRKLLKRLDSDSEMAPQSLGRDDGFGPPASLELIVAGLPHDPVSLDLRIFERAHV